MAKIKKSVADATKAKIAVVESVINKINEKLGELQGVLRGNRIFRERRDGYGGEYCKIPDSESYLRGIIQHGGAWLQEVEEWRIDRKRLARLGIPAKTLGRLQEDAYEAVPATLIEYIDSVVEDINELAKRLPVGGGCWRNYIKRHGKYVLAPKVLKKCRAFILDNSNI